MPKIPTLEEMLKAGVHFGHRTSRWHPKMAPYIFGEKGGVHIIDIQKTQEMLNEALAYVTSVTANGGTVLFISTKGQVADLVKEQALAAGMPFVNTRWLGGTFTNFSEIQKLIKNYLDLKDKREKGELKKYTKLEQLQFDRRIDELDEKIGGMSSLTKLPDAVFVLDIRFDKTAVVEAKKRGITIIGVCDTNVNPARVDYVIPANDDSVRSLAMITTLVAEAAKEGTAKRTAAPAKESGKTEDDVDVTKTAKETVDDLDDAIKDQLAREKEASKE